MTVATVRQSLIELAIFLEAVSAKSQAAGIEKLIGFLEPHGASATAAFFKKAKPTTEGASSWTGYKINSVLRILAPYVDLVEKLSGKSKAKELVGLRTFLASYPSSDLDAFLEAASAQLTA